MGQILRAISCGSIFGELVNGSREINDLPVYDEQVFQPDPDQKLSIGNWFVPYCDPSEVQTKFDSGAGGVSRSTGSESVAVKYV